MLDQAVDESVLSNADLLLLDSWARDTWRGLVALTDPKTGLPADSIGIDGTLSPFTSPTNIASWLWAVLAAREIGIIDSVEATDRLSKTISAVGRLARAHGAFYNWYDPATGDRLNTWPADGSRVPGFLSTVDNAWLATALVMVVNGDGATAPAAQAILSGMDLGLWYDQSVGLLRGGAWTEEPAGCAVPDIRHGEPIWFTRHHYDTLNSEPRIASYLGIALGHLPADHYTRMANAFVSGMVDYRGQQILPSWGGSMFEALMVPLFVPEKDWAPDTWGVNHARYVEAQIEHGREAHGHGYWGLSPSADPAGGYREFGVRAIGLSPEGYATGVVTPHASFLALAFAPQAAMANLRALAADFDACGPFGFCDAINVERGEVAWRFLVLDQSMSLVAMANALRNAALRDMFVRGLVTAMIAPLLTHASLNTTVPSKMVPAVGLVCFRHLAQA